MAFATICSFHLREDSLLVLTDAFDACRRTTSRNLIPPKSSTVAAALAACASTTLLRKHLQRLASSPRMLPRTMRTKSPSSPRTMRCTTECVTPSFPVITPRQARQAARKLVSRPLIGTEAPLPGSHHAVVQSNDCVCCRSWAEGRPLLYSCTVVSLISCVTLMVSHVVDDTVSHGPWQMHHCL